MRTPCAPSWAPGRSACSTTPVGRAVPGHDPDPRRAARRDHASRSSSSAASRPSAKRSGSRRSCSAGRCPGLVTSFRPWRRALVQAVARQAVGRRSSGPPRPSAALLLYFIRGRPRAPLLRVPPGSLPPPVLLQRPQVLARKLARKGIAFTRPTMPSWTSPTGAGPGVGRCLDVPRSTGSSISWRTYCPVLRDFPAASMELACSGVRHDVVFFRQGRLQPLYARLTGTPSTP